jgi:hypothetical protein
LAELDVAGNQERAARCFVRDDDVGELTDELRVFAEAFASHAIPVSYQIIPARFTAECAAYLLALRQEHPGLVELGQHGLHHRMVLRGRELKREFGPERSLEDQTRTIAEGLGRLRQLLGADAVIEVFTPPQHKFDGNTVRAAASAGHRIFSAASYATPHHQLAYAIGRTLGMGNILHHGLSYNGRLRPEAPIYEVSIALDVDDGKRRKFDADAVEAFVRALKSDAGLMFHHALYHDVEARQALVAIVGRLAEHGPRRFVPLSQLAPRRRST